MTMDGADSPDEHTIAKILCMHASPNGCMCVFDSRKIYSKYTKIWFYRSAYQFSPDVVQNSELRTQDARKKQKHSEQKKYIWNDEIATATVLKFCRHHHHQSTLAFLFSSTCLPQLTHTLASESCIHAITSQKNVNAKLLCDVIFVIKPFRDTHRKKPNWPDILIIYRHIHARTRVTTYDPKMSVCKNEKQNIILWHSYCVVASARFQ